MQKKIDLIKIESTIRDTFTDAGLTPEIKLFVSSAKKGAIKEPFLLVIQSAEQIIVKILNKTELQVFVFMRSYSQYNNQISLDIKLIATSLGMSERSVKRAIIKLETYNILKVIKHPLDARRNIYIMNPQSTWKGTAERYKEVMKAFGYDNNRKFNVNQLVLELNENNETK